MSNILNRSEHEAPANMTDAHASLPNSPRIMKALRTVLIAILCGMSGGCATASPVIKHPTNVVKPEQKPSDKTPKNPDSPEKGNKSSPDHGSPEDDEDIPCEERHPEDPLACRQV